MSRRAIPLSAIAVLFAVPLLAAPVPPAPKVDDSVSPAAVKLLQHRKVQKELKMTAEQRIVILDGVADLEEEYEKKLDQLSRQPNAAEEAYDKLDREHRKGIDKLLGESAAKSLNAPQRKRLGQLDWRIRGVGAFTDPKLEKLLQLTDAQKKKAADLVERQKGEVNTYFDNLGNEDDAKRKTDLFATRKGFLKQMEDLLTADQKTGWAAMLGDAAPGFATDDLWLRIEEDFDLALPGVIGK